MRLCHRHEWRHSKIDSHDLEFHCYTGQSPSIEWPMRLYPGKQVRPCLQENHGWKMTVLTFYWLRESSSAYEHVNEETMFFLNYLKTMLGWRTGALTCDQGCIRFLFLPYTIQASFACYCSLQLHISLLNWLWRTLFFKWHYQSR